MEQQSVVEPLRSSLSEAQEKILSLLLVFSGCLSLIGSSIIIRVIVKERRFTRCYDRIMLGLSCSDLLATLSFALSPFLLPADTSYRVWAVGNNASCSVLGWLSQLGYLSMCYSAILSFYFLAVIRYSMSTADFAASFEPYLHCIPIFLCMFSATIGVQFDLFSELRLGFGCWIEDYPKGCYETGNCNTKLELIFGGIPFFVSLIFLPTSNLMLYFYLKRTLSVGQTYSQVQWRNLQRVAVQGFLYVGAFYASYLPGFTVRALAIRGYNRSRESEIFGFLVVQAILLPLQGFFNMIIFIRPRYLRLRKKQTSAFRALWLACATPMVETEAGPASSSGAQRQATQRKVTPGNLPPVHEIEVDVVDSSMEEEPTE